MMNQRQTVPTIALTAGEPAGVGPDLIIKMALETFPVRLVVIADRDLLAARARQLKIPLTFSDFREDSPPHKPGHLTVLHVPLAAEVITGKLNVANAAYVIKTLQLAGMSCLQQKFSAIVTAPVHKGIINDAGIPFSGHTEFFAELTHTPRVVMMLIAEQLRVATVTTHLPLASVAATITPQALTQTVRILHADLQRRFNIAHPHIFVAGLNPHAGEGGHLGREEIEIITPTLQKLRAQGIQLTGPLPADTLFIPKYLQQADAFLVMYHDQGLPVVKYHGFEAAVNMTLGLPIIRTSVDHGSALELAGTGQASIGSLLAAMQLAIKLCQN